MNYASARSNDFSKLSFWESTRANLSRGGFWFAVIMLSALIAFEAFNYSTTDFALRDLLGDLSFIGIRWGTILSVAFCGIDFAGIARLFTPGLQDDETHEIWYLFGAWLLAATMNAFLTWWGVSMAIISHNVQSAAVIDQATLLTFVPVFVAVMVWVIRVLIIGTFSVAGGKIMESLKGEESQPVRRSNRQSSPSRSSQRPATAVNYAASAKSAEPTYTPVSMHPKPVPKNSNAAAQSRRF
ncbi:MAG: hypothetical protein JEZ00_10955 [Anaerolineaceae bacterium]|nr:hypothetical protein [Anaerolineaceae bacterium]